MARARPAVAALAVLLIALGVAPGANAALRPGQRCDPKKREALLIKGFECVRKGRGHKTRYVLRRASEQKLRDGAFAYLDPKTGLPSLDTARQAFDKQIADLPGVNEKEGVIGDSYDGRSALRWIGNYEDRLTPAQRAAVEAARNPPPSAKAAAESPVIGTYRAMVD